MISETCIAACGVINVRSAGAAAGAVHGRGGGFVMRRLTMLVVVAGVVGVAVPVLPVGVADTLPFAFPAQTIFFSAPPSGVVGGSYTPSATASSGLPVSFSVDVASTGCSLEAGIVHFDSVGVCGIDANQAGDPLHAPASPEQGVTTINPADGPRGDCQGPPLTAPTSPSSAPGDASATVSWSPTQQAPPGGCVAGYVVTPLLNGVAQTPVLIPGAGSTTVITGLTNGGSYSFAIASEDGTQIGPASTTTPPITVGAPTQAAVVRVVRVTRGALKVVFRTSRPNGAPITRYTATCAGKSGGVRRSQIAKAGPMTMSRLTPGKTYTCTVTASNRRGNGPPGRGTAKA